jgi:hypothetical protein
MLNANTDQQTADLENQDTNTGAEGAGTATGQEEGAGQTGTEGDGAGGDQPVDFDIDAMTVEENRTYLEEGTIPERMKPTAAAEDETKAASGDTKTGDDDTKTANTEPKPGDTETLAPDEQAVLDFKFTENADAETFAKEAEEYLALVELPPQLETILAAKDAAITELTGQLAAAPAAGEAVLDESTTRAVEALDTLVTFKLDPETGDHVPDTSKVIGLLEKDYTQELPQLIIDLNALPSSKYAGLTRYQEFMRDAFALDDRAMQNLDYLLQNNGQLPIPTFVPDGIHNTLAEAYWNAHNRAEIDERLTTLKFTITQDPDASDADKAAAKTEIQNINRSLADVQKGLNADKAARQNTIDQVNAQKAAIQTKTATAYETTTVGLIGSLAADLAAGLDMLDAESAGITGTGYATMIERALSDDDGYAKHYQAELKKAGIAFDWKAGRELLDKLWDAETAITELESKNANPRAIENARKVKSGILAELQGKQKELKGAILTKVVTGAGKTLETKVKGAPKIPIVRPRNTGDASGTRVEQNIENLSIEKLRSMLGEKVAAGAGGA